MLKNYFTIALRNILRNKLYSFINIGGLSIGLAVCLLIFLFVKNEVSYDNWLTDSERMYRVESTRHENMQAKRLTADSPALMQEAMRRHYSQEIDASTRVFPRFHWVKKGDLQNEETIALVDPTFFDVFDLPIIAGNPAAAFQDFNSLVITESVAKKYFGNEPAVGKSLDLENGEIVATVAAVIKDIPVNSHLKLDMIMRLDERKYDSRPFIMKWWLSANVLTYVKLKPGVDVTAFEGSLPAFLDQYALASPGPGFGPDLVPSEHMTLNMMPVADIHLHSKGKSQLKNTGDLTIVYGFSAIALLILLIAVINFTNLTTARSTLRAKEVALRKVVGASRKQIMAQFFGETLITTLIALFLALVIVEVSLPVFNAAMTQLLSMDVMKDPVVQLGLAGLALMIGCLAGAHPALIQSSFRPASILHSGRTAPPGSAKVRTILTAVQFTIAIALMIGTAVIYSQIRYVQDMDIGVNKANKLTMFHMTYKHVADVANAMKARIEALPGVKAATFTNRSFPIRGHWSPPVKVDNPELASETLRLEHVPGDFDLLEFFDAKLVAGRFFSEDYRADLFMAPASQGALGTQGGILNETAVSYLGFASPADAIGQTVYISEQDGSQRATHVVGVVEDMRLRSARDAVEPTVFRVEEGPMWMLNVDIIPAQMERTVTAIDAIWAEMAPGVPLDRKFIDERFNQFYLADLQRGNIFAYFSGFAVFVSCLGLFGMASFASERRTKEIGIRKVLGAPTGKIVALLTYQFSKPVLAANLVAWPIAWYFAHTWLQGFVYKIDLGLSFFIGAGLTAFVVASATIAILAVKAASSNPISALRHE
jgi:putative ABC transport system permease protein